MSDLIERLRKPQSIFWGGHNGEDSPHPLLLEAADEIKRLQKRVSDADECIEEQEEMLERLTDDVAAMGNECIELRLEIKRLRAALAKSCEEGRDEMYDCGYNRLRAVLDRIANSTVLRAREIAREALKDE
jgi:regulator of replication initiation timing